MTLNTLQLHIIYTNVLAPGCLLHQIIIILCLHHIFLRLFLEIGFWICNLHCIGKFEFLFWTIWSWSIQLLMDTVNYCPLQCNDHRSCMVGSFHIVIVHELRVVLSSLGSWHLLLVGGRGEDQKGEGSRNFWGDQRGSTKTDESAGGLQKNRKGRLEWQKTTKILRGVHAMKKLQPVEGGSVKIIAAKCGV